MLMRVEAYAVIGSPRPVLAGRCFAFGFKQGSMAVPSFKPARGLEESSDCA